MTDDQNKKKRFEEKEQKQAERREKAAAGQPEDVPDLENMSHEELMEYARDQGIEGVSSDMTDEEVVQMLRGKV